MSCWNVAVRRSRGATRSVSLLRSSSWNLPSRLYCRCDKRNARTAGHTTPAGPSGTGPKKKIITIIIKP